MSRQGLNGRRRAAIVVAGALALSTALAGYFATPAFAYSGSLKGTPCTVTARVCLDLDDQKVWLAKDGKMTLGPIRISSGGQGKETPKGTFKVLSKDKDHVSNEYPLPNGQPAPMPNAVFFEPGGIAFHGGDPKRASAGCVHVPAPNDAVFFNTLNVGDEVQVVESLGKVKGGFYGVNKLKPPTKAEMAANEQRLAAARKKAATTKPDASTASTSG